MKKQYKKPIAIVISMESDVQLVPMSDGDGKTKFTIDEDPEEADATEAFSLRLENVWDDED
mgnify:CR=1 FL=1